MKSIPLAALTLALPLVLSGCSSSPSIEEQSKLIAYEKCLEEGIARLHRVVDTFEGGYSYGKKTEYRYIQGFYDSVYSDCKKYRP